MRWYRNLYMGPNAALYVEKVRRRAAQGKMMPGIYYLTLPTVPGNLLDIFHNGFLKQELFAEHQRQDVIGIAEGKQEAFRLTAQIMEEVLQKTGGSMWKLFSGKKIFNRMKGYRKDRCCMWYF